MSLLDNRNYFDKVARKYLNHSYHGLQSLFRRNELTLIIDHLEKLDVKSTILDFGCGAGYHLIELSKRYPNNTIWGYDRSVEMIGVCRSNNQKAFESLDTVKSTMRESKIPYFDVILVLGVLEFQEEPRKLLKEVMEFGRAGKSKIICLTPRSNLFNIPYLIFHRIFGNGYLKLFRSYTALFLGYNFHIINKSTLINCEVTTYQM